MTARSHRSRGRTRCAAVVAFALTLLRLHAVTLDELMSDSKMTPKRFADKFEDFKYDYHPEVQPPEVFLSTESGDCQDYAILADYVLKPRNYTTRLIRVVMVGALLAHDICFVVQSKAYLDYNNRIYFRNLQRSGPRIREIADKVADSFDANWTSASEYTYNYDEPNVKHMLLTVVKTDPPEEDPDSGSPSPSAPK
jgi:hypothetical protein